MVKQIHDSTFSGVGGLLTECSLLWLPYLTKCQPSPVYIVTSLMYTGIDIDLNDVHCELHGLKFEIIFIEKAFILHVVVRILTILNGFHSTQTSYKTGCKVMFYGYETMKSNLYKENFQNCYKTRDLYSCRTED